MHNCSHAALAACPQTRIDVFLCSYQLQHVTLLPHSLHFRETNIGLITKVVGLGSHQGVSTTPHPANGHYCSPHYPAKLPSSGSPQASEAQRAEAPKQLSGTARSVPLQTEGNCTHIWACREHCVATAGCEAGCVHSCSAPNPLQWEPCGTQRFGGQNSTAPERGDSWERGQGYPAVTDTLTSRVLI